MARPTKEEVKDALKNFDRDEFTDYGFYSRLAEYLDCEFHEVIEVMGELLND